MRPQQRQRRQPGRLPQQRRPAAAETKPRRHSCDGGFAIAQWVCWCVHGVGLWVVLYVVWGNVLIAFMALQHQADASLGGSAQSNQYSCSCVATDQNQHCAAIAAASDGIIKERCYHFRRLCSDNATVIRVTIAQLFSRAAVPDPSSHRHGPAAHWHTPAEVCKGTHQGCSRSLVNTSHHSAIDDQPAVAAIEMPSITLDMPVNLQKLYKVL